MLRIRFQRNALQWTRLAVVLAAGHLLIGAGAVAEDVTPVAMDAHPLRGEVDPASIVRLSPGGVIAGEPAPPPGDRVYSNESADPSVYLPGTGQQMADDLTLASGECSVVYYELGVVGGVLDGADPPTFDVSVALWDGDPCEPGSSMIVGTEAEITGIPTDGEPRIISVTLDAPVLVPGTVWMVATFSITDAGWLTAGCPEVGDTENFWSENDASFGCDLFVFNSGAWAGYWANVHCDLPSAPLGACCDLSDCTQTTEADCTTGVWQGAFTTCDPNVCLSGTCCTGEAFEECAQTTEAGCSGRCGGQGVFTPGATCAEGCPENFKVFENDFRTGVFSGIDAGTKFGDDMSFAPGTPCDLLAFDVIVFGDPGSGMSFFDATVELWSNDDNETPDDPLDDAPLEPIAGTQRTFTNIPSDLFAHRLLASGFSGVTLQERAWLVIETSSPDAGPGLGGNADIGESVDLFAIFNDPAAPNEWLNVFNFGGFDPTGCPGGVECNPAGSFRADVWCAGSPPTGACCDRFSGNCNEDVTFGDCAGRWAEGADCDPAPFFPPCGTHACCNRFELNPTQIICQNLTPAECEATDDGFLTRGSFCDDLECPEGEWFGLEGDCFTEHAGPGCDNPFCAAVICGEQDPLCCDGSIGWDATCVDLAEEFCAEFENNDLCVMPREITGTGAFGFDNTDAGTDGLSHPACGPGSDSGISKDVWYTWTAPCTDRVFVSTCDLTFIDTKIAVYEGTDCPATDGRLLACNDDLCGLQTLATFDAVAGNEYLIRVGSAPGQGAGSGQFRITCGPPNNAACPTAGDCCAAQGGGQPGCGEESCCETVCACDAFCCTTEWDDACATTGFEGSGCGAAVLCLDSCSQGCPPGLVDAFEPPTGVIDARRPFDAETGTTLQGIDEVSIVAPAGGITDCFAACETAADGAANEVSGSTDMGGLHAVQLLRPITPGAVTTVTYSSVLGGSSTSLYISHPGNANGDALADADDAAAMADALSGIGSLPWGLYSEDIDGSGRFTPLDLWELMNLLNGARAGTVWDGTPLPALGGICP